MEMSKQMAVHNVLVGAYSAITELKEVERKSVAMGNHEFAKTFRDRMDGAIMAAMAITGCTFAEWTEWVANYESAAERYADPELVADMHDADERGGF